MKRAIFLMTLAAAFAFSTGAFAGDLTVEESSISTSVVDLEPEGIAVSFPADVGKLYAFTKITGGEEGDTIVHNWYYGEELMAEVTLNVKSSEYRTYSSKNIWNAWTGDWRVEIATEDGTVLETLNFTLEEAEAEAE